MNKEEGFWWIECGNEETNENIFRATRQLGYVEACDTEIRKDSAGSEHIVVRIGESFLKVFATICAKDDQDIFDFRFFVSLFNEGPIVRVHFRSDLNRSAPVTAMREALRNLSKQKH